MSVQRLVLTPKQLNDVEKMCKAYKIFHKEPISRPIIRFGGSSIRWKHLNRPSMIELEIENKE